MKTKHLLTAMVLPALFAACTNDDLNVVSNEATTLDSRKVVENVALNFEGVDVDSRLAYDGSYKWQANDKIGACLMDVLTDNYRATGTHWSQWFDMVDHIHTNYKFTRNSAGDWTTEAKMCEGNYFFYYPYDANAGLRNAYSLGCAKQTLANTDASALKKAFVENNAFVGYGKVYAGDNESESVAVTMVPVFGATGIVIENTGTKTYTIEKIVLRGTKVANAAVINPTTCTPETQYAAGLLDEDTENGYLRMDETQSKWFNAAQYVADDIYDPVYRNPNGWYNKMNALKDVLDYNNDDKTINSVEVAIKSGNVLKTGASINVIAMLREVGVDVLEEGTTEENVAADNQVVLDIHTDKGLIRDIKLAYKYTATKGSLADNRLITNVTTNHAIEAVGDGQTVKVTFDDTALDKPHNMEVKGDDELANLIHWNVDNQTDITANLLSNVTITKAMYNELAGSKINKFTINGQNERKVTIAADVPAGALDKFVFTNVTKIEVKGTQTLAANKTCAIEVKAGATLNVTGNKKTIKAITNYGTLNIKNNVNSGEIKNYGTITVDAGKTVEVDITNANPGYYYATITNAGTVLKLKNTSWGTVVNTGILGTAAQAGDITENIYNYGTIKNNATGAAYIYENTGKVYANELSTSRVNDNAEGNIIITNLAKNGNFMAAETGNIVQEIAAPANTDAVDKRANTIWLTSTLKVEKKNADGDYVDVNLNADAKFGKVQIIAKNKNARIEGNGQELKMKLFQVEGDAQLVLSDINVKLYAYDVDGEGELRGIVYMNGYEYNGAHKAVFTVNSDATVTAYANNKSYEVIALRPSTYATSKYNHVDNNSASVITEVDSDDLVIETTNE